LRIADIHDDIVDNLIWRIKTERSGIADVQIMDFVALTFQFQRFLISSTADLVFKMIQAVAF
jgi:hypothetical protein